MKALLTLIFQGTVMKPYLNCGGGFLRSFADEVHVDILGAHVFLSHVINPWRASGRKEQSLRVAFSI